MKKFFTHCIIGVGLLLGGACTQNPKDQTQGQETANSKTPTIRQWTVPAYSGKDYSQLVNPFIGTGGHGHTYPGATVPFGLVQLSPDTRLTGWDGCSGYHYSDKYVYGFSHTHLSGTGVSDYGDILLMPTTGEVRYHNGADGKPGYRSAFSHDNEKAEAGYYSVQLDDYKIKAELTTTPRVGVHRYTFPESTQSNIILDLVHRDKVIDSHIEIVNNQEIQGYRTSEAWATNQHVYFVAKFSKPFSKAQIEQAGKIIDAKKATDKALKAAFTFGTQPNEEVLVKVGISAVSIAGARKNLETEALNEGFDRLRQKATNAWNHELSKIAVAGRTKQEQTIFYTALYHTMIAPNVFNDVDGQYRGRDNQIHQTEGFDYYTVFSLWDTYRATHPLYTIIQQKRTNDFINTFIKQYEQGKTLPVWELAANETNCMIGYHSVPVITDAYKKGIRKFPADKAFEAMKASAAQDKFGLDAYRAQGFISATDESESVSKTLEYAYDDWCIAQMAKDLKQDDDYRTFMQRAQAYKHIFDPQTGFMRGKRNHRWMQPFRPEEVNFNFTEANSWQYSLYVPQDITGLTKMLGGKPKLDQWLDNLFSASSKTSGRKQADITGLIGQYAHGNEPSHHMAYLYNFVGKPWKTQSKIAQILSTLYSNAPDGLSGNEDCGQMSAWYVMSAMGFYPVTPTKTYYVIGSPVFPKTTLNLENGKKFTVKANGVSDKAIYIQSATLNGKPYAKTYLEHQAIMDGGELVLAMGETPNQEWGSQPEHQPTTSIDEFAITPVPYFEGSLTFENQAEVKINKLPQVEAIFYSVAGQPFQKYSQPFNLDKTTTIRAFAKQGNQSSDTIETQYVKIIAGRKLTLKSKYANQYAADGPTTLIDFLRGGKNYQLGGWQGYQGQDLEAVMDLGKTQEIKKVAMGFLQEQRSWVFMPASVTFWGSVDGTNYEELGKVANSVDEKAKGVVIKDFEIKKNTKVRYIKVVAKNRGKVPEWHLGAGGKSWIFADEILVELIQQR